MKPYFQKCIRNYFKFQKQLLVIETVEGIRTVSRFTEAEEAIKAIDLMEGRKEVYLDR